MLQGLHQKCRDNSCRPIDYSERILVPDEKVNWLVKWDEYSPDYIEAQGLPVPTEWDFDPTSRSLRMAKRRLVFAQKSLEANILFDGHGRPLNPFGRTGLCGRGKFYNWGPNFTVDGVFWRVHNGNLQFVLIRRQTGELALPGGHVDVGEDIFRTFAREMSEEIGFTYSPGFWTSFLDIIYRGYVDDPRNTDNSWAETNAFMLSADKVTGQPLYNMTAFAPVAGDDAKEAMWVDFTLDLPDKLYASHGQILKSAVVLLSEAGVVRLGNIAVK